MYRAAPLILFSTRWMPQRKILAHSAAGLPIVNLSIDGGRAKILQKNRD
jgi:hypothetical protein